MCCRTKQKYLNEGMLNLLTNNIKEFRKIKKITQEEMAKQIGMGRTALSRIENGVYFPSAKTMEKISNYLNEPLGDIFFNSNVSKNNTNGALGADYIDY